MQQTNTSIWNCAHGTTVYTWTFTYYDMAFSTEYL